MRDALGGEARTVHRLDAAVGGLMVLARNAAAAGELSRQMRDGEFRKAYLAVVHGELDEGGTLCDLLWRDKARRMTFVTDAPGKGVQEAVLDYECLGAIDTKQFNEDLTNLLAGKPVITLHTGRTHQIRCQFASRSHPLVGDRKYGTLTDGECDIALWSHELSFTHPATGERLHFSAPPPRAYPWTLF